MYNILATKSHKIFEHTELPSLVKFFFFFFGFFFLHKFYQFENRIITLQNTPQDCIYNNEQTNSMLLY